MRHILIGILGFRTGGGEIFPIHLANALRARGHHVSLLVLESEDAISDIKGLLDAGIPVYERAAVEAFGPGFFASHQFDLVHTHYQGVDRWIADACRTQGVPYVVTLHGSHEVADCDDAFLTGLRRSVDHWVYTADKNLTIFGRIGRPSAPVTKIRNAVPEDPTRFPRRRGELAPEQDAVLFGLASRALRAKGWEIAIAALAALRAEVTRPVHLALCGDGDEYEELFDLYADAPGVHFLGYQHAITGFYSLCDCCVLPTRFSGESFPFTLIEALKAGTPIIATDIGEIRNIVQPSPADTAGLLVPLLPDDKALTRAVAAAMATALNDDQRRAWAKAATRLGKDYLFDRLTSEYEGVYEAVLRGGA